MIALDADLQQPEIAAEELKHDHAQGKDVCLLVVLPAQQDLRTQCPSTWYCANGSCLQPQDGHTWAPDRCLSWTTLSYDMLHHAVRAFGHDIGCVNSPRALCLSESCFVSCK